MEAGLTDKLIGPNSESWTNPPYNAPKPSVHDLRRSRVVLTQPTETSNAHFRTSQSTSTTPLNRLSFASVFLVSENTHSLSLFMKNDPISSELPRRSFLKGISASGLVAATKPLSALATHHGKKSKVKLGYDNFAVRAMNWMVEDHLKYAEKLKIDSLFIQTSTTSRASTCPICAMCEKRPTT